MKQRVFNQVRKPLDLSRGPSQVFTPVVSLPELEALVYNWTFFETNIRTPVKNKQLCRKTNLLIMLLELWAKALTMRTFRSYNV
jgi:hypothetical protein